MAGLCNVMSLHHVDVPSVAAHRADQVFLPVLENAVKAQKLRSTLGVFERSKFLFNLPGSLLDSVNAVSVLCPACIRAATVICSCRCVSTTASLPMLTVVGQV